MVPPTDANVPPLTITAAQARALRDGSAEVWAQTNSKHETRMSTHRASRVPSAAAVAHAWLGKLKVIGLISVDGHKAIKLVPVHGPGEYDVAPGSYYPIRELVQDPSGVRTTTTWSQYRVLPATSTNERLLSLAARRPGARVDRSRAGFLAAWTRLITGD